MEYLNNPVVAVFVFIFGAVFASFFGVIIGRHPQGQSIVKPASHCTNCNHVLKWYENIPILSWLFLGGKCSKCKAKIGLFWFIFEVVGACSLLLAYLTSVDYVDMAFKLAITLILLLIAGYDYQTHYILDITWIILAVLTVGYYLYAVLVLKQPFAQGLIGAAVGFGFFGLFHFVGPLILHKDCLGMGDVIITTIMGLILKPFGLLLAILIASLSGSIITIIVLSKKKQDKDVEIAFCPYLCIGFYVIMLYGASITSLLLGV